ncbi:heterodisulfide reductase-related iron-sulfur binding cluster [Paenibacillus naphthalenovorans]|uniref:heterodisulfide reductase-related iron-sulfur binding cluster n=1 Tax=Paenibacillus naphthalenovorans TaxID=162209 RepID=UPI00087FE97B|nr:heterodisulfide reductase-related iron-sulfur binding cluster [Paenibacillus naphthalenovorans]GCL71570.1 (Fe-S)-binding protein [Paenibacillus naphthalenovorans]SDI81003.1 Fe-S oxidoreductase [Paenibacillus naphthalenovorans]
MWPLLNFAAFIAVSGFAVYWFAAVVYSRITYIRLGKPHELKQDLDVRIREFLIQVFGQKKLLKDKKSGMMHMVMFYGFIILQFGAVELIVKGFIKGFELPLGAAHPYFSLTQEVTTFLVLLAVAYAFYRRYVEKLSRLKRGLKSGVVILFLAVLMSSILLSLAFERLWLGADSSLYAPFSSLLAALFTGLSESQAGAAFYIFWWVHLLTLLAFLVYVPQSKHAHLLFAPVNIALRETKPYGKLSSLHLEDETQESFGAGKVEDFRRNQLIDLYACVECGRCTQMCPASNTGKTLSPMDLIVKLRDHLTEKGAVTSRTPWMPSLSFASGAAAGTRQAADQRPEEKRLIGDVITEEELWACTTCRNCEDQCPVSNEHVEKIIDMRRYLVLTQGDMPHEAARYFQHIERQSNPWGISRKDRIKWREGREDLVIPTVEETDDFEYLFFVGSMGSFDIRSQNIARSFAKILNTAGVKFAILGNEEKNSGDSARRMGNEMLFQQLCQENIAAFQAYGVKKIVTICPHTYNTFKNEYPEFGLEAEVFHHTELIWKLIQEGRIRPEKEMEEAVAYHDSCYLGRYNGIFDIPRHILQAVPGVKLLELERNREDAMCCGAGGGMMWLEESQGKRVNVERTEQALQARPTVIGSNCPYCLTMMSDGVKSKGLEIQVQTLDIAEIVERALL